MRIHVLDLQPTLDIDLTGNEAWLEPIYNDFPLPEDSGEGAVPGKITGNLHLARLTDEIVRVQGHLRYAPLVACSRCMRPIEWAIDLPLDVYYQRRGIADLPRDITLKKGELDEYYFDGETIDLAELVNDMVQTAMPTRFLPDTEDGSHCNVCHINLSDDQVYGQRPDEADPAHPFAALKGLKTKH